MKQSQEYEVGFHNGYQQALNDKRLVEVVRCEKCKWRRDLPIPLDTGETIECEGRYHKGNWYCADGKREDGAK